MGGGSALCRSAQLSLDSYRMIFPRTRIVVPGALLVAALGLIAGAGSVQAGWIDRSPANVATFLLCVVMGPIFFVYVWLLRGSVPMYGVPLETLTFAVLALIVTPLHPFFQKPWAAAATVVGLLLWLLCSLIV